MKKNSYVIMSFVVIGLLMMTSISGYAAMSGNNNKVSMSDFAKMHKYYQRNLFFSSSYIKQLNEGDLVGTNNPTASKNDNKWDVLYYYCQDEDCFSVDNIESFGDDYITVMRGNLNKYTFETFFSGNVRIDQIEDDNLDYNGDSLTWLGPRLTLSDPDNMFKKYEIRFYSEDNPYRESGMLQINYVDRSNWFNQDNSNNFTPSQVLKQVSCDLKVNETYFVVVSKTLFGNLKVNVMNFDGVTCEVKWSNGMMSSDKFELGVQSAGKYVISSFSELISY